MKLAAGLLPGVVAGLFIAPFLAALISLDGLRVAILSVSALNALLLLLR
jgi:hypothetical protein